MNVWAVRMLKKPWAMELKVVMFCLRLYLIVIVWNILVMSVILAWMKQIVEKNIPHWVKI